MREQFENSSRIVFQGGGTVREHSENSSRVQFVISLRTVQNGA